MTIEVSLDDDLLRQGLRLGGQPSREALLDEALREYIQRRERQQVMAAFGTFDFDPDYDYKDRRRRSHA